MSAATSDTLNGVAGQLVTIQSAYENELVRSAAAPHYGRVWLGASDQVSEGDFYWYEGNQEGERFWTGGSAENGAYTNFNGANPDNGGGTQHYIRLYTDTGLWDDNSATAIGNYIVEWDASEVLSNFTFSLTDDAGGRFAIDSSTGEITVADGYRIDYEQQTSYDVDVQVTDATGNSYTETMSIAVDDATELDSAPTDLSSGIELNTDGGNDAYLQAADGGLVLGGRDEITIELEFASDDLSDTPLIHYYTTNNQVDVYVSPTGDLKVSINDNTFTSTALDYRSLADGNHQSLAISWDNTNGDVAVYVNGEFTDSGTGISQGHIIATGGSLVFGQEQDALGGGFDSSQVFQGTLYDVRIWDEVRSEAEISLNHQQKFDTSSLPSGLIANWQMDGFNGSNEVVDVVSANNLSIGHATGTGFIASTPVEDLHISENATDGASVGFVVPSDPDWPQDVVSDGLFLEAPDPGVSTQYNTGQTFGGWTVTDGDVELIGSGFEDSPLGGRGVALNGNNPGAITQTLATEAGRQYQVVFAASGTWGSGDEIKDIRVSADGESEDFSISEPPNWSPTNMLWQNLSFSFTADGTSTDLTFASLDAGNIGPAIADVQVIEIPQAVSTILNNDPTLSYDANTGKFYRAVNATLTWTDAQAAAVGTNVNGVSGQLVTIRSAYENELVRSMLSNGAQSWLGAADLTTEGDFNWYDGTAAGDEFWTGGQSGSANAGFYENFADFEPFDSGGQDYVLMYQPSGTWDDVPNGHSTANYYVIEWDASEVLSSFTFNLTDDAGGRFAIGGSTGEITVADGYRIDYEQQTSYDVDVEVTDATGNSYTETMSIAVDDATELDSAPTDLSSGIELNTDGGNDAYLYNTDAGTLLSGLSQFTFESTFSSTNLAGDETALISYATSTDSNEILLNFQPDGRFGVAVAGSVFFTTDSYAHLFDGDVHTVSLSWDNTNGDVAIYVDGELVHTETNIGTGQTIDGGAANGTIVFGNEQDSLGGAFATNEVFAGTLYDVRIWNEVRSEAEISLNHQQKFDSGSLPNGLIANWQMDGFNGSNEVVDVVSANNLSIGHAAGAGFTSSMPVEDLHIGENATNGTSVGVVVPTDPDSPQDILSDGTFNKATPPAGSYDTYHADGSGSGSALGDWTVISGSVDLHGDVTTELGGMPVDLSGDSEGAISNTLTTVDGRSYQVIFSLNGNFGGGDLNHKDLRASAGGESADFVVANAGDTGNWNQFWERQSFTFTANSNSTDLIFESLELNGYGPIIGDIQVVEIPQAINTILNDDPTLSYDAATGKFYRHVASAASWNDALAAAAGTSLNGESGSLVSIESAYENQVVRQILSNSGWGTAWLGGSDQNTEGDWHWYEGATEGKQFWQGTGGGTAQNGSYTNFAPSQPDGSGDELHLSASTGLWDDGGANTSYIIEWDASKVLSSYTFNLTDDAGGRFAIDSSTGEITVADGSQLDYEASTSHNVTVEVTDAAGNTYSEVMTIAIDDDLDDNNTAPTFFAGDGTAVTILPGLSSAGVDVAVLPDGKYIVASGANTATAGQDIDFALVKYNADGSLDTSFGTGGQVITAVNTNNEIVNRMVVQDDGKIIVVGGYNNGGNDSIIIRYNADGTLDNTFSGDGMQEVDVSASGSDWFEDVVIQADGKIVAVGYGTFSGDEQIFAVRFNDDGSLDNTFGTSGQTILPMDVSDERAMAVALQSDGKVIIGGRSNNGADTDFALRRLNTDGTLDTTFGTLGIVAVDVSASGETGNAIYVGSGDEIFLAGSTNASGDNDSTVVKFDADGNLDASFGTGGVFTVAAGVPFETLYDLTVQSDGKIVAVGEAYTAATKNDVSVIRINANGTLDTTFGTGGIVRETLTNETDSAKSVRIDANGNIMVAGNTDGDTFIARFDSDGNLDDRFDLENTLDGNPTFVEDGAPVLLDADVKVFDEDLSAIDDFGGSSLTLARNGSPNSEDVFHDSGNLLFDTSNVLRLSGTNIGSYTNTGGTLTLTFAAGTTNAQVNEVMQSIEYENTSDAPPANVSIEWVFDDGNTGAQGTGGALEATGSTTVNITAVNDAPVIDRTNLLVNGDLETGNLTGWTTTGTVTNTGYSLRFGEGDAAGPHTASQSFTTVVGQTYTLTFQYRDDSASLGQQMQVTVDGATNNLDVIRTSSTAGTSYFTYTHSFVADSTTSTLTFTDVSPSSVAVDGYIDNVSVFEQPTFTTISEDDVNNGGNTVASILSSVSGDRVTDADAGAVEGIAVTDASSAFDYSLDGGATWQRVANVSQSNALLLRSTDLIRFVPNEVTGQSESIEFRAWDQTSGTAGTYVSTSSNGGTTAFSTIEETASIVTTAVNDAPSFGSEGGFAVGYGESGYNQNVASLALSDGSVLFTPYDSSINSVIGKLGPDGQLDTSFGVDGYFESSSIDYIRDIQQQSDGKFLVTGDVGSDIGLARYNADGTLDAGFGSSGVVVTDFGGSDDAYQVAVHTDGTIVVVGRNGTDSVVARYTSGGVLDNTFSGDGIATVNFPSGFEVASSVTILSDGKVLVAGGDYLARFTTAGALDTTFDGDGLLDVGYRASSLVVQADGDLVVAGFSGDDIVVSRFDASGSPDLTFGTSGTATFTHPQIISAYSYEVIQQSDGKLLVAGTAETNSAFGYEMAVVRFNTDGSVDTAFGDDGVWLSGLTNDYAEGYDISLYDDGGTEKIVVGGYSARFAFGQATIARLNPDGSLDTTYQSGKLDGNPTFTEGGAAVVLDDNVQIFDAELNNNFGSDDFGGSALTLERNGGANTEDVFSATGNLVFNAGTIELSSSPIGTYTNVGGQLVLTFAGGTTNAEVNEAMRSIAYANSSDAPPTSVQIDWTFNDGNTGDQGSGGDLEAMGSTTVDITPVEDAPVISDLAGDTLNYTEGDGQVKIDQNQTDPVSVFDPDSTDFDGGTLTVSFAAGSDSAEDVLSIIHTGSGIGEIGVSGGNVTFEGSLIGTFTGGSGGSDLVVTLNANADHQATRALLLAISYENTDTDAPTTGARTVRFALTDGDGGTSADYDTTVNVAAVNDAPTITNLLGDTLNYSEGDGAVVIEQGANAVISDVDSSDFDTGTLTVGFDTGSNPAEDVIAIRDQGTGAGQVGVSGSDVTFSGS